MAITIDAVTLQPVKAAQLPAAPVTAVPQVVVAESARGSRRDQKNDNRGAQEQPLSFRAVLDAATAGNVKRAAVQGETAKTEITPRPTRVPKSGPAELSGDESPVLLEAAFTRRGGNDDGARPYLKATSRYAQAFFADTRTFARPGESLEMTV